MPHVQPPHNWGIASFLIGLPGDLIRNMARVHVGYLMKCRSAKKGLENGRAVHVFV